MYAQRLFSGGPSRPDDEFPCRNFCGEPLEVDRRRACWKSIRLLEGPGLLKTLAACPSRSLAPLRKPLLAYLYSPLLQRKVAGGLGSAGIRSQHGHFQSAHLLPAGAAGIKPANMRRRIDRTHRLAGQSHSFGALARIDGGYGGEERPGVGMARVTQNFPGGPGLHDFVSSRRCDRFISYSRTITFGENRFHERMSSSRSPRRRRR